MELIAAIATAIATVGATVGATMGIKSLERIGENTGDVIWEKVGQLINKLRQKKLAPQLTAAVDENKVQELHYDQAVKELTEAMQDEEIKQAVLDLESSVNTDKSNTAEEIKKKAEEIKNDPDIKQKIADTIIAYKSPIINKNEGQIIIN